MKENKEVADTNVGDIEEAIERLEYIDRTYSCNNYYSIWDLKCIDILLSDYKRVLEMNEVLLKENEELKSENRRLKVIRCSTEYGTENIHLITKRDLVEINTNKYFIEIQDRKFVDLKQVYLENKKLNEYKENYIPKDKIEEILSETEITDFNSLVEAFLEIKKLLESE